MTYRGDMLFIGGLPEGEVEPPKIIYRVEDCKLTKTNHSLPFVMAGHVCSVHNDKVYICGSMFNTLNNNCTGNLKYIEGLHFRL